jgi:hypothetical protein
MKSKTNGENNQVRKNEIRNTKCNKKEIKEAGIKHGNGESKRGRREDEKKDTRNRKLGAMVKLSSCMSTNEGE